MQTKQKILLFLKVYSLFITFILFVFYIVLVKEHHFYQWNLVDARKARSELLLTAFQHFVILLACVGYEFYQKKQQPSNSFRSINQHDDQDFNPSQSIV